MSEGDRYFQERGAVFEAMRRVARRLDDLQIPYAVVGGMALFQHGLRRFTEDVDILVTKGDLRTIHQSLDGLGYLPAHRHSKNLRDTESGVRIEFLTTGDYPGDGKIKPVAFPNPVDVAFVADGVRYLDLRSLVELKLASGMTQPERMKDLADVVELIKILHLPKKFAEQLDPFVREQYDILWRQSVKRYVALWRNKWLTAKAKSIEEMIAMLRGASDELAAMHKDGVFLDASMGGVSDDYAHLVTTDPEVARKYDMIDEREFWADDEDGAQERTPKAEVDGREQGTGDANA